MCGLDALGLRACVVVMRETGNSQYFFFEERKIGARPQPAEMRVRLGFGENMWREWSGGLTPALDDSAAGGARVSLARSATSKGRRDSYFMAMFLNFRASTHHLYILRRRVSASHFQILQSSRAVSRPQKDVRSGPCAVLFGVERPGGHVNWTRHAHRTPHSTTCAGRVLTEKHGSLYSEYAAGTFHAP